MLSKTPQINTAFNKLHALAVIYTVKNSSLASCWDSNQALRKPTGTAHPSNTKLRRCHAAQTFRNIRNDQNKVDCSEFDRYVIRKFRRRAQNSKGGIHVCLVIEKLSDEPVD